MVFITSCVLSQGPGRFFGDGSGTRPPTRLGRRTQVLRPYLGSNFLLQYIVTLSFLFGNYYLITDYLGLNLKDSSRDLQVN